MKYDIEDYIKDHRNEFDTHEPSDKVWKAIESQQKRHIIGNLQQHWVKIAAVVIVLLMSVAVLNYTVFNQSPNLTNENTDMAIETQIPELSETENYYNTLVNEKLEEVRVFAAAKPELEQELMTDFAELDSILIELKTDLKDNASNEEVVDAMVHNYRIKLKILEDLLSELQRRKTGQANNKQGTNL
ncbi:MAG TPA: hypothetical protein DCQ31_04070 [Bacteroidales bacterium]|nr:hypothetical protein [Bacteroidales bacterium]